MKHHAKLNEVQRQRRAHRTRSTLNGSSVRPRLSVKRSSRHIYAQLINDAENRTLLTVSDSHVDASGTPLEIATAVGALLAKKAKENNVQRVVFDRGAYRYHGRVRALAEGAREGGLEF